MIRTAFAAALLLGACATAPAPQTQTPFTGAEISWMQTFSSPGDDWINDIVPLRNGRYLGVGFLNRVETQSDWRALAVEFGVDGAIARQSEYGAGGGVDSFWNAAQAEDGTLTHVGFTTRIGAGGIDAYLLRTDTRGRQLSETSFGEGEYDRVTDLAPTADGGWILVGHSVSAETEQRRMFIVRANAEGGEVWRRIFTERESSGLLYIEPAGDGGFILTGGAAQGDDGDLIVIKLDAAGGEVWRRLIGAAGTADVNHGVVVRPDGRIVAVGYTQSWGAVGYDMFAVTLNPQGELLQRSVIGTTGDDRTIGARLAGDGRVWITGYTRASDAEDWDISLVALGADGRFQPGAALISSEGDDNGTCVLPLAGGDLLLCGYSTSLGGGAQDAFILRMRAPDLTIPSSTFTVR